MHENPDPNPAAFDDASIQYPWSLLWAVTTAAAAVARADGAVDEHERHELNSYLQRSEIRALTSPIAAGLFEKCLRELARDPANERRFLANVLAGFEHTPWAWLILHAAEHVATADGTVHPTELRVIDSIRTVLGLPPGVPERYPACVFWRRLR
jgi:tellurite resistance protein